MNLLLVSFLSAINSWALAQPITANVNTTNDQSCFPALGFNMPQATPSDYELEQWWCDAETEHAFLGFSYEVTACE